MPGTANVWGPTSSTRGRGQSPAASTSEGLRFGTKTSPLSRTVTIWCVSWPLRGEVQEWRSRWFASAGERRRRHVLPALTPGIIKARVQPLRGCRAAHCTQGALRLAVSREGGVARTPSHWRDSRGLRSWTHVAIAAGHVIADGLQALENRLPLLPVQLPQKRPETLNERIFQQ